MCLISKFPSSKVDDFKFSIVIPSWNNLEFLRMCVDSIEKNSFFTHQIIIHVNDGSDGTLEWVKHRGYDYTHSTENIGICFPLNAARSLLKTNYFLYMNDDMYVCPVWDKVLWEEIENTIDNHFFFSATMIEPELSGNDCVIAPHNFGRTIADFDEKRLLESYQSFSKEDWHGSTWPPNIVHKDTWDLVGGYSVEFTPGMGSDPDFAMKLWKAGVRNFKGLGKSRVYHFMSKTTAKVLKNNGNKQFLFKWGMTLRTFTKYVLLRGDAYCGILSEPKSKNFKKHLKKSKLKMFISLFIK